MTANVEHLPATQRGLVIAEQGKVVLETSLPLPKYDPDQLLVKIYAVAVNPSDYKFTDFSPVKGAVTGADLAGVVVAVGSDCLRPLPVGTRICCAVFGSNPDRPDNGAFSEYAVIRSELCIAIPGKLTFAQAASLPVAVLTTPFVLRSLRLPTLAPLGPKGQITSIPVVGAPWVLVNGGATATGTILIQVLKHLGCQVVATCSPENASMVSRYGARKTFDYNSSTCAADVRTFTKDKLAYAIDCVSTVATMTLCYGAIGSSGGRYTSLEPYSERIKSSRPEVKPDWVLTWTAFGVRVPLDGLFSRPPILEDLICCSSWIPIVEPYLATGKISPHPLLIRDQIGLEHVAEGFDLLRKGKVRGKKLIYRTIQE